mmetsp:Transcript_50252/g.117754  ORF Transcript_50252/g.117754 Transcript_50252/m.117754 type:complete len:231 (+) Transcript_50252:537-1229(+)
MPTKRWWGTASSTRGGRAPSCGPSGGSSSARRARSRRAGRASTSWCCPICRSCAHFSNTGAPPTGCWPGRSVGLPRGSTCAAPPRRRSARGGRRRWMPRPGSPPRTRARSRSPTRSRCSPIASRPLRAAQCTSTIRTFRTQWLRASHRSASAAWVTPTSIRCLVRWRRPRLGCIPPGMCPAASTPARSLTPSPQGTSLPPQAHGCRAALSSETRLSSAPPSRYSRTRIRR